MTPWQRHTVLFIIALAVTIATYDIVALWRGGAEATISQIVYDAARNEPIAAFVFGVLMGHLFWPQR